MKHPKSENILKVIEVFKKVLPQAIWEDHLDMCESKVNSDGHSCGTIHCHAGWFAIGSCDISKRIDFSNGAKKMANVLGFRESIRQFADARLEEWAQNNPNLWGNRSGEDMFICHSAFYHPELRPAGALNLQHIIDHWTEVHERVKALEDQQTRKDATAHLLQTPVVEEKLDVVGEIKSLPKKSLI